ncbi:MAG: LytR/AlgR family response regulator transcription factor [Longimicrobiales bacterium]
MQHATGLQGVAARPVNTLIVDDDRHARRYLRGLLDRCADIAVVGEATDGSSAVTEIERLRPDLVFLDVELPDQSGFGLLEQLGPEMPRIVFVTGYDRYAVRAFEVNAVDYLVKPVDADRLQQAVARAVGSVRNGNGAVAQGLGTLIELLARGASQGYIPRLAVKDGQRIRLVPTRDIDWIEATDKVTLLHVDAQTFTMRDSLSALQRRLDPLQFMRIHRSAIVNVSRIEELQPWAKGDFFVRLRDGTRLTTGPSYRSNVQRLLRGQAAV